MGSESWWPAWSEYKRTTLDQLQRASAEQLKKEYSQFHTEPIHQLAKFPFDSAEGLHRAIAAIPAGNGPHFYTATDNPTTNSLEDNLARMETYPLCECDEKWRDHVRGLAFACGAGAITAVLLELTDWSRNGSPQGILASKDTYTSATMMFEKLQRAGVSVGRFSPDEFSKEMQRARQQGTWIRAVYVETPSHTLLEDYPLREIAAVTTRESIPLVVDSTLATPYCMQPLLLGADIVIHSTTKYINGAGDRLGGAVIGPKEFIRSNESSLLMTRRLLGSIPSVVDSNMINENLKDLPVRMHEHCESARHVAGYLAAHPRIKRVNYPSITSHPTRDTALSQMREFGAIITLETQPEAKEFYNRLRVFRHAVSYGDKHSLVLVNAQTGSVRLAIGREPTQNLIDDLERALAR